MLISNIFTDNIFISFVPKYQLVTKTAFLNSLWFCLGTDSTWLMFGKDHGLGLIEKNSQQCR